MLIFFFDLSLAIILTILAVIGIGVLLRFFARMEWLWIMVPVNCFTVLVSDDTSSEEADNIGQSGAGIVGLLHSIPGKRLQKGPDPMKWKFVNGIEDGIERNGFLYRHLGVQWKGLFPKPRKNKIRYTRFAQVGGDTDGDTKKDQKGPVEAQAYQIVPKDEVMIHVFFSGDESVLVEDVETKGTLRLNFRFNFIYERESPVLSLVKIANANAYLTTMTKEVVNNRVGTEDPEIYLGGIDSQTAKEALVAAVKKRVTKDARKVIGIKVIDVNLYDVEPDQETVALLELQAKTERENNALVSKAKAELKKKKLENAGLADHVNRVILPIAENEGAIRVRQAEAYENNDHVTVYAPGGGQGGLGIMVDPRNPELKKGKPNKEGPSTES